MLEVRYAENRSKEINLKNHMKNYILIVFIAVFLFGCAKSVKKDEPVANATTTAAVGEGSKIVQNETKVTFVDEAGTVKLELPVVNKSEIAKEIVAGNPEEFTFGERAIAKVCDNGDYIALIHENSKGAEDFYESTCTFKYYNKNGDLLWQKDKFDIFGSLNIISGDGKRILYTTRDELYRDHVKEPVFTVNIFNEKGEEIWSFGEFNDVNEQFITKNGMYGYMKSERMNNGKWENGVLFFDIRNKKTSFTEEIGYASISEEGKADVSIVLESIFVRDSGKIEFFDKNGDFKFESYINKLNDEQKAMLKNGEIEEIQNIVNSKKEDHILRDKIIYEYQFK